MATPRFGLDFVGDIHWGTHLCLFYETKDDLRDILVPYFAEGLCSNEACVWVTSEPLGVEEATAALAQKVPNLRWFTESGQLLVLQPEEWYLKGGIFNADRVLEGWVEKEHEALRRGFRGPRLTGNTFWIKRSLWNSFTAYEEAVNSVIGEHRMIAVCTYALEKCSASDVIDVERNHVGTIIKHGKNWMIVEDVIRRTNAEEELQKAAETVQVLDDKLRSTNEELLIANQELEPRVNERSTELSITNEELKAANEELRSTNDELSHEVEQRTRAEQAAQVHARRAETLTRIISAGNHADSLQKALAAMLDTALDLLPLNHGGIFLRDRDTAVLQHSRGYTAKQRAWAQCIPIAQNLTRRVMAGDALFLDDYQSVISPEVQEINRNVGSMALIPLEAGGKVLGFYSVGTRGHRYTFTEEERRLLVSVGQEAGTVIASLKAEDDFRASSEYTRNLIEASLDPLVTISSEGKITDANGATEDVTGCGRDKLVGSDFSTYFTEPEKARAGYQQAFTYGFVKDYPLVIKSESGKATDVLYNATVYRNKAGEIEGVFAAARDITKRKRAEAELQRYSGHLEALVEERTAELKDAERLVGIGETAAMIGHDLRNPLQGLQYIVDLQKMRFDKMSAAQRSDADWQKERQLFNKISEQVFYMDKIVGDLQDYARPLDPEREAVSIRNLIEDVLRSLPQSDGKVHINVDLPDLTIEAEPHLMHRVFSNLFLNALQAMPDGGTLTVSATTANGSVVVSVCDTGVGIPNEMRNKLFSPLMTGKAKGTGLGLAVVKRIVDAHGGTIT